MKTGPNVYLLQRNNMRKTARAGVLVLWSGPVRQDRIGRAGSERRAALLYLLERLEPRVLLSAGDLDLTFGSGGKVVTNLTGGFDAAASAIVLSNGKILVGGRVTPPNTGGASLVLARYNSDGTLDTTFGDGGTTEFQPDSVGNGYVSMALDSDGDILVATDLHRTGQMTDFGLYKFSSGGQLDESFGDGGVVRTDVSTWDIPESIGVRADGKIVVSGWARTPGYGVDENGQANDKSQGVVIRYNSDGSLDSGFGDDGVVNILPASNMDWVMGRAAIAPDGNVIFAGNTSNLVTQTGHAILREIGDDGSITSLTFGNTGDDTLKAVKDVKIDSEGRIVMLLTSSAGMHLARFAADGTPDSSFGTDGWVTQNYGLQPYPTLRVAADDSILVAGEEVSAGDFAIAHYLSDGSVDAAFGTNGVVNTAFGTGRDESIAALAFSDDGKIVAVGQNEDNHDHESKFLVARYDAGDWGGSGEYVDGDEVEGSLAGGNEEDTGSGGEDSQTPDPSLSELSQSLVPPTVSPFAVASAGETLFGKPDDLFSRAGDLL
jgi:uncharacterized delta-60 repeat protein